MTILFRLHKLVLDYLGVQSVAVVIGGSMGGMAVLEWPLCTPPDYVRKIIPIATSARHSAWCISWGEAQRQSIYSDPGYEDGYYRTQPASGLAAARMAALLTYRSRDSFESRFGRKAQDAPHKSSQEVPTPPDSPISGNEDEAVTLHNDGHKNAKSRSGKGSSPSPGSRALSPAPRQPIFSAQSYLRYQGDKFINRFDANCYIHITRKLDTHDLARARRLPGESEDRALARVLSTLPPRTLVIGIQSDGLFTPNEQRAIAEHIRDSELVIIPSPEGHDGFLLEFELINSYLMRFLKKELPEYYQDPDADVQPEEGFDIKKTSLFGEAEADITRW